MTTYTRRANRPSWHPDDCNGSCCWETTPLQSALYYSKRRGWHLKYWHPLEQEPLDPCAHCDQPIPTGTLYCERCR